MHRHTVRTAGTALVAGAVALVAVLAAACGTQSATDVASAPGSSASTPSASTPAGDGGSSRHPHPSGPGKLAVFVHLKGVDEPDAPKHAEVTDPADLDRYLAKFPAGTAAQARTKLAAHKPSGGDRVFAFLLSGCQATGAKLMITKQHGLTAATVGGEHIRCLRAEHYLAIFTLGRELVPADPLRS